MPEPVKELDSKPGKIVIRVFFLKAFTFKGDFEIPKNSV